MPPGSYGKPSASNPTMSFAIASRRTGRLIESTAPALSASGCRPRHGFWPEGVKVYGGDRANFLPLSNFRAMKEATN
jgi:hypothetical protein